MEKVDIAVIGAGVVGLAVAAELSAAGHSVVLLEKNPRFGQETSSRNSEVIHSGIHYKPGTLKAKLCVEGNDMLYGLCARHAIPCKPISKLTVAVAEHEVPYLVKLKQQGEANGVRGMRMLDAAETRALEPEVRAICALLTPSTGIIDSHQLMEHFARQFRASGGILSFDCEVTGIERRDGGYAVRVARDEFCFMAGTVVNCAGLYADKVATLAGIDIEQARYRLAWCKGEYFALNKSVSVSHLVYGVPSDNLGLGIHIVLNLAGAIRLGPNAFYVDAINYDVNPAHRNEFFEQARFYFEGVNEEDLAPDTAGIRPKLALHEGFQDFIITDEKDRGLPGFINLIGIESPGLTSSPAIARYVRGLIRNT